MDDPQLDPKLHDAALAGLRRINRFSGTASVLWTELKRLHSAIGHEPLRILDIACGSGDNVIAIGRKAARHGISLCIDGCDISEQALQNARELAVRNGKQPHRFIQCDAIGQGVPEGYHIVMCSLFLHHLSDSDATALISSMASSAINGLLIDDLRRTGLGYALAWAGCRLLSRSPIVHFDGPQSVRAAFSESEVLRLVSQLQLRDCIVKHHWPQRFTLSWIKPAESELRR
ncbi:methyltransferase domain-containing protein [Stieleria sp. JC731]|uniref:methyltransferase domain-containing protein n=1 Tax=Pirellulaceae TaxID=2691357 RepID=UPI001E6286C9|nr:methyltransferase domain-containing protein [Stieleria sp. JC731]MCC9603706.1 methyltransferase domain-containing protein [Stieleria sp. JC731]